MFNPPNLSQSQQPKAYYDYDGLSGGWLRFPWWVHLSVALLAWPLCWWVLPLLPFQNAKISYFLEAYKIQLASAISILTVMTACFSYVKALRIQQRNAQKAKSTKKVVSQKMVKVEKQAPRAETITQPKKTVEKKPKKATVKTELKSQTKAKSKVSQAAAPKKKRVTKKKNDKQVSLNFDE